jgi:prepilin-type N-terminal cleavage/methylation domain-containing protein
MTVATGDGSLGVVPAVCEPRMVRFVAPGSRRLGRGKRGGFTLIEILIVMAILVVLFGFVAISMGLYMGRAARGATTSVLQQLELFLDDYKGKTGHYPPDGIDSPQRTEEGTPLRGSACLYYFLSRPIRVPEVSGGRKTVKEYPPIAQFKEQNLMPEDPEYPGVRELKDGWGTPMHYDNTENKVFRPQRGEVHYPEMADEDHPEDPRNGNLEIKGVKAVVKPGIQGKGFDIWSHGEGGHDFAEPSLPVATWNKE